MFSIFKNLSRVSLIKIALTLAVFTMLIMIFALKSANASLSVDNKALAANTIVLKSTNAENTNTITFLEQLLQEHEQIAYERSLITADIVVSNNQVKHDLGKVIEESKDETVVAWVDAVVPVDIVRLLNNSGGGGSNQNDKDNPSKSINIRL